MYDLVPVSREEFVPVLLPCLQLVAPAGMGVEEQDLWFEAAFKALEGIPIKLLKRGAQAALMRADHPSKIVATITKEIGEDWAWRRKASDPNWLRIEAPAPDAKQDLCSPDDARAILKRFGLDKPDDDRVDGPMNLDPARPCRKPTREDYIRMGVSPDALEGIAA